MKHLTERLSNLGGTGRREQEHTPAAKPGVADKIAGGTQKVCSCIPAEDRFLDAQKF